MQYAWFLIFYILMGAGLLWYGLGFIRQPAVFQTYLTKVSDSEKPPRLILRLLRYILMFSLASLIVSFVPFALYEMLYSVLLIVLVFTIGRLFLMWDTIRQVINEKKSAVERLTQKSGFLMVLLSILSFSLWFRLVTA